LIVMGCSLLLHGLKISRGSRSIWTPVGFFQAVAAPSRADYVQHPMDSTPYLTGQFLLAMPGIGDPRFDRAVIAMCSHDADGAMGIALGTVIDDLSFHDVLKQLEIDPGVAADVPVHIGGPCETRRGFVLHSRDWAGGDTVDVAGRWALSGTLDVLKAIATGTGPSQWIPALGYAGWGEGQLDGELTRHGWFNVAGDDALLFDTDADDRWEAGFAGAGIDPRMLAPTTGNA
jgi:putative transcriptional regulator